MEESYYLITHVTEIGEWRVNPTTLITRDRAEADRTAFMLSVGNPGIVFMILDAPNSQAVEAYRNGDALSINNQMLFHRLARNLRGTMAAPSISE